MSFYKRIICVLFLIFTNPSNARNGNETQDPKPSTGANNLIKAIKEGDVLHIQNLLRDRKVDVKARDETGRTALHWAAEKGYLDKAYVDIVHLLIRRYAQVNARDRTGDTPLLIAAGYDQVEIMEKLISAGADVNVKDNDGRTPLLWTAGFGYVNATKLLIDKNANARIRSQYNETPLHWAVRMAKHNKMAVVKLLLEKEASFLVLAKNNGDKTALDVAKEELAKTENQPEVFRLTAEEEKEYQDIIKLLEKEMAEVKANAKKCKETFGKPFLNKRHKRSKFKYPNQK